MNTVKRWLATFLSTAMVFTSMGLSQFATVSVSAAKNVPDEDAVVVVSTKNGSVNYDDFAEALTDAQANETTTNPTFTLKKDVDLAEIYDGETAVPTINFPMTIVMDGGKLVETDAKKLVGDIATDEAYKKAQVDKICRGETVEKNVIKKITFAKHKLSNVYNWQTGDASLPYYVVSISRVCDNCGTHLIDSSVDRNLTKDCTEFANNECVFNYTYDGVTYSDSKDVDVNVEGYEVIEAKKAAIVTVNGVNQHKDGLPVVQATLLKKDTQEEVVVDAVVTPATDEEIAEYNKNADPDLSNTDPDCQNPGTIVYKVVVTAPDGVVMEETLLADNQAIAKLPHTQGALYGYQLLKKSGPFTKKSLAEADAKTNKSTRTVEKYTESQAETGNTTNYYYWYWDNSNIIVVNNADASSTISNVTLSAENIADDGSFAYRPVYNCNTVTAHTSEDLVPVYGESVTVEPYKDATKASEYNKDGFSTCTAWKYPAISITYEFTKNVNDITKTKYTFTGNVQGSVLKPSSMVSHVSDGSLRVVIKNATCDEVGLAGVKCAICEQAGEEVAGTGNVNKTSDDDGNDLYTPAENNDGNFKMITVEIPKLAHKPAKYIGNENTLSITDFEDEALDPSQTISLSEDGKTATVAATCTHEGGIYTYCEGNNRGGHWVKESKIEAIGHDLASRVAVPNDNALDGRIKLGWHALDAQGNEIEDVAAAEGVEEVKAFKYVKGNDYTFTVKHQCKNDGDAEGQIVRYHSIDDTDYIDTDGVYNVYNAIEIVDQDKGDDCQTFAKSIYTVKGITDTADKPIVKKEVNGKPKGEHVYNVTQWNWASDYEKATVTAKCTVKNCDHTEDAISAKVTKSTTSDGITTYVGTFGDNSDTKKVYTLKNAVVTYDKSLISDGNLIEGVWEDAADDDNNKDGKYYRTETAYAAPQTPPVTVTVNGTVIDSNLYTTEWSYNPATKVVKAKVAWTSAINNSDAALHIKGDESANSKESSTLKVANKYLFSDDNGLKIGFNFESKDGVEYEAIDGEVYYYPNASYKLVADSSSVKGTSIKYAITDKPISATSNEYKADEWAVQRKIEALDYSLDSVEDLHDAGTYYVYAMIQADGYTTYACNVAMFEIVRPSVKVYVDNASVIEGDKPNLHIRAVEWDKYDKVEGNEITIDPSDFTITTQGGESIDNLKAGTYRLRVTAKNYDITTDTSDYVATLTVLAKDGSTDIEQAEAEAVAGQINALTDTSSAQDVAAARAAYDKLTDAQKARINAETLQKLTAAEDKVAADKIVDQLNKATTDADKAAAYEAYSKLSDAQKKLVDAKAADAVAAAKTAKDTADKAAAEEAAKKEAAAKEEASKTATSAKSAAAKVASTNPKYSAVQSAVKALDKVLADQNATSAQIKAATDKLNAAVTASKTAGAKKGATYTVGGQKYKATSTKAVTLTKAKNAKSVTVPATVKINGKKIAVTKIGAKAFAKSKATKVTIKTKKLTKKGVKNSLKGSKVKTVKVSCGKAYVKKYKKFFTKANAGKKVAVK